MSSRHRLRRWASGRKAAEPTTPYEIKLSPHSSHGVLLRGSPRPAWTLLDVGCSDGRFGSLARRTVIGSPASTWSSTKASGNVSTASSRPTSTRGCRGDRRRLRLIVAADVLEHTIDPGGLLGDLVAALHPTGRSSPASRTSPTGTPAAASPPAGSTTTNGAARPRPRSLLHPAELRTAGRRARSHLVRREVVGSPIELLDRGGRSCPPGCSRHRRRRPPGDPRLADDVRLSVPVRVAPGLRCTSGADGPC